MSDQAASQGRGDRQTHTRTAALKNVLAQLYLKQVLSRGKGLASAAANHQRRGGQSRGGGRADRQRGLLAAKPGLRAAVLGAGGAQERAMPCVARWVSEAEPAARAAGRGCFKGGCRWTDPC